MRYGFAHALCRREKDHAWKSSLRPRYAQAACRGVFRIFEQVELRNKNVTHWLQAENKLFTG